MLESLKFDCPILTEHNFIPCQRILMKFSENCHNMYIILLTCTVWYGGWMLGLNDSVMSKMMTVGVVAPGDTAIPGMSLKGRRPSTLKCIGSISRGRYRAQPSVRN